MKPFLGILLVVASFPLCRAATIVATDVATLSTYTTGDGLVTLTPNGGNGSFSDNTGLIGVDGGSNNNAVDNAESITIDLAAGAYLTEMRFRWSSPQSDYTVSTVAADPSASFDPNGVAGETGGVSYAGGTLTINIDVWSGTDRIVTLSNPTATSGQSLTLELVDKVNNRQLALSSISYDVIPEPGLASLVALSALGWLRRRR